MKSLCHTLAVLLAAGGFFCCGSLLADETGKTKKSAPTKRSEPKNLSHSQAPHDPLVRNKKPVVSDVALDKKGILHGVVVDAQGVPAAGVSVSVMNGKRVVVQLKTDKLGRFAVTGLRAGVYQVMSADGSCLCRLWAPASAPPSASEGILVVSRSDLLRAQYSPAHIFASDRFLLGTTIVGAAAVPVAIYSNRGSGS